MDERVKESWDKLLNPKSLKDNLINSSLFLSAYEIMKSTIIEKPKDFFTTSWHIDQNTGELKGEKSRSYKEKVISLYKKDEFHACCLWFYNHGVLNDDDLERIKLIRRHRNEIAHELPKFLADANHNVDRNILNDLYRIVRVIEFWWIKEIEVPTNPDLTIEDYEKLDLDNTHGGNTLFLSLILSVYDGDDSSLEQVYNYFNKNIH